MLIFFQSLHKLFLFSKRSFKSLSDPVLGKIASYRQWFEKRLGDAIQAADAKQAIELQPHTVNDDDGGGKKDKDEKRKESGPG